MYQHDQVDTETSLIKLLFRINFTNSIDGLEVYILDTDVVYHLYQVLWCSFYLSLYIFIFTVQSMVGNMSLAWLGIHTSRNCVTVLWSYIFLGFSFLLKNFVYRTFIWHFLYFLLTAVSQFLTSLPLLSVCYNKIIYECHTINMFNQYNTRFNPPLTAKENACAKSGV